VKVKELAAALDGYDPEMEVQIRINITDTSEDVVSESMTVDELDGEYCAVTDERSVLVEYGKLTIIGDWTTN
jgi:hypothetical protein